jgi:hypothetical protein
MYIIQKVLFIAEFSTLIQTDLHKYKKGWEIIGNITGNFKDILESDMARPKP